MEEDGTIGKPMIFIVDDDTEMLQTAERAMRRRGGADFRVVAAGTPATALEQLREFRRRGAAVALLITDQWLPDITGVEFLRLARERYPGAQRGVLATYGDWSTVGPLHEAAILGQVDFFCFKPWASPDEWLYPTIGEYLSRWARTHRPRFEVIRVIGEQWAPRSHELRDRLERNVIPYGFYPHDSDEGRPPLASHRADASRLPVVSFFTA